MLLNVFTPVLEIFGMSRFLHRFCLLFLVAVLCFTAGCVGEKDDETSSSGSGDTDDDDDNNDDNNDNDDDDDDTTDDDDDDDDDDNDNDDTTVINPTAKADAFKLFYKERAARTALSINRFAMSGDAVAANTFAYIEIAKEGNEYEVIAGPEGNNQFGYSAFATWKLYKSIGGRNLELTLIRMFEGMVFNEAISGHSGLTTREAFPGWTRVMNGVSDQITRTKWGAPIAGPVTYPPTLEQEIMDEFYDNVTFTYRENPEEFLFNFKAINELGNFAMTYVFDELHDPSLPFMRVSDCCSSFMIPQTGPWQNGYWGNHNSRDNFTDYALGFIAAFEVANDQSVPADLATAAANASAAAHRTGDNIAANDNVLMTVDEWHDYNTQTVAGNMNPDGEVEWQDLGSLASCLTAYLGHAVSTNGLDSPVPEIPLPGAIETSAIRKFFTDMGMTPPPLPVIQCQSIDEAFIGIGWGDILNLEILGVPWHELADVIAMFVPDLFPGLMGGFMDDLQELVLGAMALTYYAQIAEKEALFDDARQTLSNLVELQKIAARLTYGANKDKGAKEMLYKSATWARMFNIEWPLEDFGAFAIGDSHANQIEDMLGIADTPEWPLLTDQEIYNQVEAKLAATINRAYWRVDRYRDRFDHDPPIRRAGDGYECIGVDDQWQPTENPRHVSYKEYLLWFEAPLCEMGPGILDCSWAKLGCAPVDFDQSGVVDSADSALFDAAWSQYGQGADCSATNDWCDGADLDRNGTLDQEDRDYLEAAQGCKT